uniref:Uncharacterized protein n=1 Tax=Castor canadensis TaxID=51338 RepID=A0A8C0ZY73_CASCN
SVASRHAPEGQWARTVLLRRQSWRGGSGAVALRGEGGWSRQRSEPCGRRCLAPGARPDPFSLARLEGARTASVPGVHPAGHRFPGVRPPGPQARAREELQRPKTWARPRVLRVRAAVGLTSTSAELRGFIDQNLSPTKGNISLVAFPVSSTNSPTKILPKTLGPINVNVGPQMVRKSSSVIIETLLS